MSLGAARTFALHPRISASVHFLLLAVLRIRTLHKPHCEFDPEGSRNQGS
jgi:hypothetical protein